MIVGQRRQAASKPTRPETLRYSVEPTNSAGAKRRKTAARPLTTDDLPTLIKEVFNNLRQTQDESDSSEESHDGERQATRQARQDQGVEQDSGNKERTSSRNTATIRQRRTNSSTRRPMTPTRGLATLTKTTR